MNKKALLSKMVLFGDNGGTLSEALGMSRSTFSAKINESGAEFTQGEIMLIMERYSLSPEEVADIFFNHEVS